MKLGNPLHIQQNMVCRSYILVNLILSSCSLEYGDKKTLKDVKGNEGIGGLWNTQCPNIWSVSVSDISTCIPKKPEQINCIVLSLSYKISEAKEMYVNIQTNTRNCKRINITGCTGKFSLLLNYQINENDFKSVVLPDEIPKKSPSSGADRFYDTDDNIRFAVEQNYKSFKLGLQAPFYCGRIKDVSLFYYLCPTKTSALVDFPEILAPTIALSPSLTVGKCRKNAVKKYGSHSLLMKCYYNGTAEVVGGCECEAGYTKKENECKG